MCINPNYNIFSWPVILIICFLALFSFFVITYINRTILYKNYYPIQELSPYLTVLQQLSIYIFVLTTMFNIAFYITGVIQKYITNDRAIELIILVTSFIMLFGRGVFIIASIFKALRIHLALKCNLDTCPNFVEVLKNEKYLVLIISGLSIIIWCFPYIIWRAIDYNPDMLIQIEKISIIGSLLNFIEIFTTLIIALLNFNTNLKYETFKKYIFQPMVVYGLMLFLNQLLLPIIVDLDTNCISIVLVLIWLMTVVRSCIVYYCMIVTAVKNRDPRREAFIPSLVLSNFNNFLAEEICRTVFQIYLEQKFSSDLELYNYFCELKYSIELHEEGTYESLANEEKYEKLWDKLEIKDKLKQINLKDEVKLIYENSYDFFNLIYEKCYKRTKSFQTLEKLYQRYEKASVNLYKLGLCPYITGLA